MIDVPNFEAMIATAVANALPNLSAALRTQITNDIMNGAGASGGSGDNAIPQGIHVWIERSSKPQPVKVRKNEGSQSGHSSSKHGHRS
ncbi:hypothetical protein Tco_1408734 [Tanacetum coccineum]